MRPQGVGNQNESSDGDIITGAGRGRRRLWNIQRGMKETKREDRGSIKRE